VREAEVADDMVVVVLDADAAPLTASATREQRP
jgi:hypothetical protein